MSVSLVFFYYHTVCACREESRRYDLSGQFVMPSRPEPPDEGEWTIKPDFLSLTGGSWSAVCNVHCVCVCGGGGGTRGGGGGVHVCICGVGVCHDCFVLLLCSVIALLCTVFVLSLCTVFVPLYTVLVCVVGEYHVCVVCTLCCCAPCLWCCVP